jgi:hypothetical protein
VRNVDQLNAWGIAEAIEAHACAIGETSWGWVELTWDAMRGEQVDIDMLIPDWICTVRLESIANRLTPTMLLNSCSIGKSPEMCHAAGQPQQSHHHQWSTEGSIP